MDRKVVVTGIGMLSPLGSCKAEVLDALRVGKILSTADHIDPLPARMSHDSAISSRLVRKIDKFTQYALLATDMAIADRGGIDGSVALDRVGVFVGNGFGGWGRTDAELRSLYQSGLAGVSPYQATAWFPAAPQGQITIRHGFKGFSKTISADRTSGLMAVGEAASAIATGRIDMAIAGATEALCTPYVAAVLCSMHERASSKMRAPYAEGAVFLVLETEEGARGAGSRIYGAISGFASGFSLRTADKADAVSNVLLDSLSSDAAPSRVVYLDTADELEVQASRAVYGSNSLIGRESNIGDMYSVSGVMQVAIALSAFVGNVSFPQEASRQKTNTRSAAVHAFGGGGGIAALQLSAA